MFFQKYSHPSGVQRLRNGCCPKGCTTNTAVPLTPPPLIPPCLTPIRLTPTERAGFGGDGHRHSRNGRVWGVAEDRRRRAGDRGAHHKVYRVPPSVLENRAPLIL
ncbi:MAG: hypothetical protein LBK25_04820 [Treponema sp.]|nr:hypothetical protein [Treponema sp.]